MYVEIYPILLNFVSRNVVGNIFNVNEWLIKIRFYNCNVFMQVSHSYLKL